MTLMQELLQYTMHQHLGETEPVQAEASEDLGEWAAHDTSLSEGGTVGSSQNGSPAKQDSSVDSDNPMSGIEG